jgi:putative hemolysin
MDILIILFLILLNGVFAMSEIAMVSSSKPRLQSAAKRGDRAARKALDLSTNPGKFLSTVQIGITLIGILTGIYSGEKIEDDLISYLNTFDWLKAYSKTIAVSIIVVTLTFFSLVLGELVPKRIGLTMPEKVSRYLSFPMYWISVATAPFIWLLTVTSDLIIRIFRIRSSSDSKVTEEEIKAIIKEGTEGGAIQEIERDIVERVFILGDRNVSSLMTYRDDVVHLKDDYDAEKIRKVVDEEMHSIYPVLNSESEWIGIVLLKDLFRHIRETSFKLTDHIRQPQIVAANCSAFEALRLFKTSKIHYAVIVDEFGQMQGLITMNDLLESLVVDVSQPEGADTGIIQRVDGSWLIDGQYPLIEFLRRFDLDELILHYPYNTISGLILHELRRIPSAGDSFRWRSFDIEIVDMDGARIDKVLFKRWVD